MAIKSLEDLKKMREATLAKVQLRETGQNVDGNIEVMIGLATCGIAAGGREAMQAIIDQLAEENITDVRVVRVGCLGYCHSEPTVQVNIPGEEPVLYGNVSEAIAKEIVTKHIKGRETLNDNVLMQTFTKA
jgi:NADP-reducing hydrogenase subunit HndB